MLFSTVKINEHQLWVTLISSAVNCDSRAVPCKELWYSWVEWVPPGGGCSGDQGLPGSKLALLVPKSLEICHL